MIVFMPIALIPAIFFLALFWPVAAAFNLAIFSFKLFQNQKNTRKMFGLLFMAFCCNILGFLFLFNIFLVPLGIFLFGCMGIYFVFNHFGTLRR